MNDCSFKSTLAVGSFWARPALEAVLGGTSISFPLCGSLTGS